MCLVSGSRGCLEEGRLGVPGQVWEFRFPPSFPSFSREKRSSKNVWENTSKSQTSFFQTSAVTSAPAKWNARQHKRLMLCLPCGQMMDFLSRKPGTHVRVLPHARARTHTHTHTHTHTQHKHALTHAATHARTHPHARTHTHTQKKKSYVYIYIYVHP